MKKTQIVLVAVIAVGLASMSFAGVAAAQEDDLNENQTEVDEQKVPGITSSLLQKAETAASDADSSEEVTVMVRAVEGQADEAFFQAQQLGDVEERWGNLMEVSLWTTELVELSEADSVGYVREPLEPVPDQSTDGAISMNATDLHNSNVTGDGVEVAVIDQGFDPAHNPIQDNIASTTNLRSGNIDDNPDHGTASAESVVQVAPDVDLHLYAVGTEGDILTAIDDIEQNTDADVVTMSLSFKGGFPLDGTDQFSQEISESVNNGSYVWFNSAGNEADGNNWNGEWQNPQDDFLGFEDGDTEMDVSMATDEALSLTVQWDDDFGASENDYDLYLYDRSNDTEVASSENPQTGTENPVESIYYNGSGDYYFRVEADDAFGLNEFDIFSSIDLEYSTSGRSLSVPATGEDVTTVGAAYYANKNLETFSSRGPTIDGRLKPDLTGPDQVSTGVGSLDPFYGTSAATPQTAGAAALLFGIDPGMTPEASVDRLKQAAVSVPNTPDEPNSQSGYGFVDVAGAANMSVEIANVDGSAGGVNSPIAVETTVDLSLADEVYDGPVRPESFNITVGNNSVDTNKIVVLRESPGRHTLRFVPPSQPDPGSYNLTVEVSSTGSDTDPNAITYSAGEVTQTATSLQIDRSGSMSGIMDEAREGAVTFVEQAKDEDYVSIVSYASSSTIDQNLVRLQNERQNVTDVIRSISSGGNTNIGDAMTDGLSTLDNAPNGSVDAGVLMTDGQRNRGPTESEILNSIVPSYNSQNVCLYTIGFTDGADEALLQDIADASDCGYYEFAGESGEVDSIRNTLQSVFRDIEGDIAGTDTLHRSTGQIDANSSLTDNFNVDDTVFQATANIRVEGADFTVSADQNTSSIQIDGVETSNIDTVALLQPDGTEVNDSTSGVNVSIVGDSLIYRINDPESGEWSYNIQNTQQQSTEYTADVSGATQSSLDIKTAGGTYYVGDTVDISATLVGTDGGISGASVDAVVTSPDGTDQTVALDEASTGVYTGSVTVDEVGEHDVEVTAEKGTLSRTKVSSWTVESTAPISVTQSETPRITQGNTRTFKILVEPDFPSDETVTLEASRMTAMSGQASLKTSVSRKSLNLSDGSQPVNISVTVPKDASVREYRGNLKIFKQDGTVVSDEINVKVEPKFNEPLIGNFVRLPENTQELDEDLFEDLSGDGDGTDVDQTIRVFGELIRGNDLGLNDNQARVLDWYSGTPETEVRPADMVTLFGKQIRSK